jgi:hypothetical protein
VDGEDGVSLAKDLLALEEALLRPPARYSPAELERLLTEDFREFGASGTVHDRASTIDLLMQESRAPFTPVEVSDFTARKLGDDAALVTYYSKRGDAVRLRSSIWRRDEGSWRMMFHQGTPARQSGEG